MEKSRFSNLELDEDGRDRGTRSLSAGRHPNHSARGRDVSYYMEKAFSEVSAGAYEAALRAYSATLGQNPLLIDAWVGQVCMLTELGEYREARIWADKALEKFPEHADLLSVKAVALYRMGLHTDARELSDAALRKTGESDLSWLCRGELMVHTNPITAESCFDKALSLSPHKGLTRMQMGAIYLHCRKYSLALAALKEAAAAIPNSARAWHLLGMVQEILGYTGQSQISFRQAAALAPANPIYRAKARPPKPSLGRYLMGLWRRIGGQ